MYKKFYEHEKNLRIRNCRRGFIKNLLSEKHKENMENKQPRFKSRLNKRLTLSCAVHNRTIFAESFLLLMI